MERRRLPRWLVSIAVLAAVLVALVVWQSSVWKQENAAQRRCLLDLQDDIAKAQAAGRKWGMFQDEAAQLEKELRVVERLLPARLDVEGFRETLTGELAARGVQTRVLGVQTFRRGRLYRAELQVEMAGEPVAIADHLQRGCCGDRLTTWNGSSTDAGVRGALSTYAMPAPPDAVPIPCPPRRTELFLWPFSVRAEELARAIQLARVQLAPVSETLRAVRRYERTKFDLEERIEMINEIRNPAQKRGSEEREEPVPPEAADRPAPRS
jgi:hypothetical protein